MTNSSGKILVIGGTGKVGGQAVRQLADTGAVQVRALVRNPESARLPDGVEMVRGDLADPASLTDALTGVDKVFLVFPTAHEEVEAVAAEVVAQLAKHASRIVYLSSMGAAAAEPKDPINGSHANIERLIRESGAQWTFVRGGGFAGNDLGWAPDIRDSGVVREPFAGWQRSLVHEADLAAVAVQALLTDDHVGHSYDVTGPEALDQAQRVRIIAEVTDRALRFEELDVEAAREYFLSWLPADAVEDTIAELSTLADEPEPVTDAVRAVTGRPARTYREWVRDHLADFAPLDTAGVAAEYVLRMSGGDLDGVARLHAPHYVRIASDEMTGPPVTLRADQIAEHVQAVEDTETLHDVQIDEPLVQGDRFALRFTFDSTHNPTGARGTYSKISLYTVDNGHITREEVYFGQPPHVR